jgi:hypothetical protein
MGRGGPVPCAPLAPYLYMGATVALTGGPGSSHLPP